MAIKGLFESIANLFRSQHGTDYTKLVREEEWELQKIEKGMAKVLVEMKNAKSELDSSALMQYTRKYQLLETKRKMKLAKINMWQNEHLAGVQAREMEEIAAEAAKLSGLQPELNEEKIKDLVMRTNNSMSTIEDRNRLINSINEQMNMVSDSLDINITQADTVDQSVMELVDSLEGDESEIFNTIKTKKSVLV